MTLLELLLTAVLLVGVVIAILLVRLLQTIRRLYEQFTHFQVNLEKLLLRTAAELIRAVEELQRARRGE